MRHLHDADLAGWVEDTLISTAREKPVVAVTSQPGSTRAWVNPDHLQVALGDLAEVVFLETGDATWALSELLPPRFDVYGGAMRIWWPGLSIDDDPYDHRLYIVRSLTDAEKVVERIVAAVREFAGPAPPEAPETVLVTSLTSGRIEVATTARRGTLVAADLPVPVLVDILKEGLELEARPVRPRADGAWDYSIEGLLPNPWERFAAEIRTGDVVIGRVQNLHEGKKLVFVDLLPAVVGVCHVSELDYGYVANLSDFVRPGELLPFEVRAIDPQSLSLQLSHKRAHGKTPRALPSLVEGGHPFEWRDGMPMFESLRRAQARTESGGETRIRSFRRAKVSGQDKDATDQEIEALKDELTAASEERASLVAQIRDLRQQLQDEKKARRAGDDRSRELERLADAEDPLGSERAFLLGVRLSYARLFEEDDRQSLPLQRMRVGRFFLESVRKTDGIDVEKVLEVCAQVAANMAHTIPARQVHSLRAGSRGADSQTRKRDGARAWRCALQIKTPSARRLHWWSVPGQPGPTIEFACIGVHDNYDIPED